MAKKPMKPAKGKPFPGGATPFKKGGGKGKGKGY